MSYDEEYYCPHCNATLNDQDGFDPSKGYWRCTSCGQMLMDDDVADGDAFEGVAWFCDGCGELLNRQDGFSDSLGHWTCTSCGHKNPINEDAITDEDEGPECPSCGAKLKDQYSFSDWSNDHTCTECGANLHRDYSSDDFEVVEEEEDEGTKCPNCGAKLEDQYSFYSSSYDHECSECGAKLHRDYSSDDFEVVEEEEDEGAKCPNCGAKLEDQYSFYSSTYDHTCTECSAKLHRDYSSDEFEIVEDENGDDEDSVKCPHCDADLSEQYAFDDDCYDYTCEECGAKLHREYSSDDFEVVDEDDDDEDSSASAYYSGGSNYSSSGYSDYPRVVYEPTYTPDTPAPKKQRKRFGFFWWLKFITIMPVIIIATGLAISIVVFMVNEYKAVPVGFAEADFIGKDYAEVKSTLESVGFSNIVTVALDDLPLAEEDQVGKVANVTIEGRDDFAASTEKSKDAKIVIEYHTIKLMDAPFSNKDAKGQMYDAVVQQLTDAGFVNIRIEIEYDLLTGWITKDGEVESVTINGDEKYSAGAKYRPDAEVVVTYHTFKKNKPE